MPRALTIVIVAMLLGAAGASASGASATSSASDARVACGPSGARTLAAAPHARVYSSAGTVYGCASAGRGSIRLGVRDTCMGNPRVDPVIVTGILAAYGSETCGIDTGTTVVVVRRLTDGQLLHRADATSPVGPEAYESVASVVLKGDGAVAWIGQGQSLGTRRRVLEVWRSDRHGVTRLESSASIHPRSLRLRGSVLHWREGAGTQTAVLR